MTMKIYTASTQQTPRTASANQKKTAPTRFAKRKLHRLLWGIMSGSAEELSLCRGGVTIGNNVVIGAGSIVTKDIPDNAVAYGAPYKIMRENAKIHLTAVIF